jgi:hypothetical protein
MGWRCGWFEVCPGNALDFFLPPRAKNCEHDDLLHRGCPWSMSLDSAEMMHEKVELGRRSRSLLFPQGARLIGVYDSQAAFYFVGMTYKTILAVPASTHGALLDLGAQFNHVLIIAWRLPIITLGVALLASAGRQHSARAHGMATLDGGGRQSRLAGRDRHSSNLLPEPLRTWLDGAAFNVGWLVLYLLSTVLLWNGGIVRAQQNSVP